MFARVADRQEAAQSLKWRVGCRSSYQPWFSLTAASRSDTVGFVLAGGFRGGHGPPPSASTGMSRLKWPSTPSRLVGSSLSSSTTSWTASMKPSAETRLMSSLVPRKLKFAGPGYPPDGTIRKQAIITVGHQVSGRGEMRFSRFGERGRRRGW